MASHSGWNPFQNEPLKFPEDYSWLKNASKTGGGDNDESKQKGPQLAPFNRMVDGWLIAIALGVRARDDDRRYEPPVHRFETGSRLAGNTNAIIFLHHVALAELLIEAKTAEERETAAYSIIDEPANVIAICNDLAARGMPILRAMIEEATIEPLAEILRSIAPQELNEGEMD